MAHSVAVDRICALLEAMREREKRSYRVQRSTLSEKVHVLMYGHSILCNPTGLRANKLCAVAFPSKPLLQSVREILNHDFRIAELSTDSLLDHVEKLAGVRGVFELNDCYCTLEDRKTIYDVKQIENEGTEALVSERCVEFDN
jgi:hypothetical protein